VKSIGTGRQNQDLGEDENRPFNDDDAQRSNNSDDNYDQYDDNFNNNRGRIDKYRQMREFLLRSLKVVVVDISEEVFDVAVVGDENSHFIILEFDFCLS